MSVPQTTNHRQRGGGGVPNDNEPAESRMQSRQLIVAEVQRGHEGRTGYNEGLKAVPAEVFRLASLYVLRGYRDLNPK